MKERSEVRETPVWCDERLMKIANTTYSTTFRRYALFTTKYARISRSVLVKENTDKHQVKCAVLTWGSRICLGCFATTLSDSKD